MRLSEAFLLICLDRQICKLPGTKLTPSNWVTTPVPSLSLSSLVEKYAAATAVYVAPRAQIWVSLRTLICSRMPRIATGSSQRLELVLVLELTGANAIVLAQLRALRPFTVQGSQAWEEAMKGERALKLQKELEWISPPILEPV